MSTTVADEKLEQFLTQCGVKWQVIPPDQHASLNKTWDSLFGTCFYQRHFPGRYKQGVKAQFEYSQQSAESFFIVPFIGDKAGPHSGSKSGPRKAAYECHCDGTLPDLSAFAGTNLFIVPTDWRWTMVHTHEDYITEGPYFLRQDWLALQTRRPGR